MLGRGSSRQNLCCVILSVSEESHIPDDLRMTLDRQFFHLMSWLESISFQASYRKHTPLINSGLFKIDVHPDTIFVDRTRLKLALGGKLPDCVFCVCSFEQHGLKGPFR